MFFGKIKYLPVISGIAYGFFCTASVAQPSESNQCLALFDAGYYTYQDEFTAEDQTRFEQVAWCRHSYSTEQEARDSGIDMDLVYAGLEIGIESNDRYQRAMAKRDEFCAKTLSTSSDQFYQEIHIRYPNSEAIRNLTIAYNTCLSIRGQGPGLKCLLSPVSNHIYSFTAWYSPGAVGEVAIISSPLSVVGGETVGVDQNFLDNRLDLTLSSLNNLALADTLFRSNLGLQPLSVPADAIFAKDKEVLYQGISTTIRRKDRTDDLVVQLNTTERGSCTQTDPGAPDYTVAVTRLDVEGVRQTKDIRRFSGGIHHSECKKNVISPIHSGPHCINDNETFIPESVRVEAPRNGGFLSGAGGSADFCFRARTDINEWRVTWNVNNNSRCLNFYAPVIQCGGDTSETGGVGYYPGGSPPCRWAQQNGTTAYLIVDTLKSEEVKRVVSVGLASSVASGGTANFSFDKSIFADLSVPRFKYDISVTSAATGQTAFLHDDTPLPAGYQVALDATNGLLNVTVP